MSIRIISEKKNRQQPDPFFLYSNEPASKARGFLVGSEVIIEDSASMAFLTENGFYGYYLGQRMNFYNSSCFPKPEQSAPNELGEVTQVSNHGAEWLTNINYASQRRLHLGSEEAVYLMKNDLLEIEGKSVADLWNMFVQRDGIAFKRRFLLYQHLRNQGWTVRSAVTFSGDFSIYKENPKLCHSSAVIQIVSDLESINNPIMIAMRRHLKNVKKAFVLTIIKLDTDQNWETSNYDSSAQFDFYHSKTPLAAHKLEFLLK